MDTVTEAPQDGLNGLPTDVLAHVLSYVPLYARLRDCACVNSTWHAAAVKATHSIRATRRVSPQPSGLPAWLLTYGAAAQVSRLDLYTSDISTSFSAAVGHTLPALEQLHSLCLSGEWREAAVAQLRSLRKLQELDLSSPGSVLHAAVAALPSTLTSLALASNESLAYLEMLEMGTAPFAAVLTTTDAVELTAQPSLAKLQRLKLRGGGVRISFPAVAQLPELRTCIISFASIAVQEGGPSGLSALSALTSLQHLDLSGWFAPLRSDRLPRLDASDCAALTASTQLTFLSLSKWQLQPELCSAAFPPNRRLPLLRELHLGPCFLHTPAATARVVSAAPGLAVLEIECCENIESWPEAEFRQQVVHTVILDGVQKLRGLKVLDLEGVWVTDSSTCDVLAQMTQLTGLRINHVTIPCLPGILQLTTLTNLDLLSIGVKFLEDDEGYCESGCILTKSGVPVYMRLPAQVVKCTAELFSEATDQEVNTAMPLLLEAAEAVCPAAVELFWSFEQAWQGVQAPSDIRRVSLFKQIDSTRPLLDQLQKQNGGALEHLNAKLAAASAAGIDQPTLLPQQQQEPGERAVGSGSPAVDAEGGGHASVVARDDARLLQRVDECDVMEQLREACASGMRGADSLSALGVVSEGRRLLAAVQDLKAEVRRMGQQGREKEASLERVLRVLQ